MKTGLIVENEGVINASQIGRRRMMSRSGEPLFYADWDRALFIHYEVEAEVLQRWVPYPLDLYEGRAFVSMVAFAMVGMRLRIAGKLGAKIFAPIGSHTFLNVRTYVEQGSEVGIYFMREWLPNRLAVCFGPGVFGLPYRYGQLHYDHRHEEGMLRGQVSESGGDLSYQVKMNDQKYAPVEEKSLRGFCSSVTQLSRVGTECGGFSESGMNPGNKLKLMWRF